MCSAGKEWRSSKEIEAEERCGVAKAKASDERFPACRARWSQRTGGEVWCDEDAGYPRKELTHVGGKPRVRCACFPDEGFSDARLLYPGCASNARRCAT